MQSTLQPINDNDLGDSTINYGSLSIVGSQLLINGDCDFAHVHCAWCVCVNHCSSNQEIVVIKKKTTWPGDGALMHDWSATIIKFANMSHHQAFYGFHNGNPCIMGYRS